MCYFAHMNFSRVVVAGAGLALGLGCLFGGGTASVQGAAATSLHLDSPSLYATKQNQACTSAPITGGLTVTGTVKLTNIPVSCQGKQITGHTVVALLANSVGFSGSASGSSITFSTGRLTSVLGVQVLIDGWQVPIAWSAALL